MEQRSVMSILTGLNKLGLAMRSAERNQALPEGLSATQAQILAILDGRGPQSPGVLAELLGVRQPTVSDAVAALERKGLVRREADPADRRRVRVTLSTTGGQRARELAAGWPDLLQQAIDDLPEAERAVLQRAMVRMIKSLQDRGRIPVARMCVDCTYFRPYVHSDARRPHHCAYVDEPFGDAALRVECSDFGRRLKTWRPPPWHAGRPGGWPRERRPRPAGLISQAAADLVQPAIRSDKEGVRLR